MHHLDFPLVSALLPFICCCLSANAMIVLEGNYRVSKSLPNSCFRCELKGTEGGRRDFFSNAFQGQGFQGLAGPWKKVSFYPGCHCRASRKEGHGLSWSEWTNGQLCRDQAEAMRVGRGDRSGDHLNKPDQRWRGLDQCSTSRGDLWIYSKGDISSASW